MGHKAALLTSESLLSSYSFQKSTETAWNEPGKKTTIMSTIFNLFFPPAFKLINYESSHRQEGILPIKASKSLIFYQENRVQHELKYNLELVEPVTDFKNYLSN